LEQSRVTADWTVLAKSLGGGYAPLAPLLVRDTVAEAVAASGRTLPGHSYGGSPLSCAVGVAVVGAIEREGLLEAARARGARLRLLLEDRLRDLPVVGDIRGLGLMQAVELVRSRERREPYAPAAGVADSLWHGLWRRGVIAFCMRPAGTLTGDFAALVPPLVVTDAELERGVDALRETIVEASAGWA
jgi:adenosylmethionine-8-amino-7-oxononanoate aminotransferase